MTLQKRKLMKSGTTTIGIVCKDGVVLGADKRMSAGHLIASKHVDKIIPLNEDLAVTTAGLVSDAQLLTRIIKAQIRLESIKRGHRLLVKEVANLLANMVYGNIRRMSMVPSIVGFLMGGRDDSGYHLYSLGIDGSITEYKDYFAEGSGMMFALGVLQSSYTTGMAVDAGITLAVKTVNAAIQRDMASGDGIDVVTITEKGVKKVFHKKVETAVN